MISLQMTCKRQFLLLWNNFTRSFLHWGSPRAKQQFTGSAPDPYRSHLPSGCALHQFSSVNCSQTCSVSGGRTSLQKRHANEVRLEWNLCVKLDVKDFLKLLKGFLTLGIIIEVMVVYEGEPQTYRQGGLCSSGPRNSALRLAVVSQSLPLE